MLGSSTFLDGIANFVEKWMEVAKTVGPELQSAKFGAALLTQGCYQHLYEGKYVYLDTCLYTSQKYAPSLKSNDYCWKGRSTGKSLANRLKIIVIMILDSRGLCS